ncbi:MAG TPA: DUF427 domain-containing protein [Solirubrobacteraceae bacterium]|nr:DUF427 domain-containing protein [Solirubrobacteraceae bacterium]
MGLAWQQGPLAPGAVGRFLVPDPLPKRMLYAEPLRRRMRVRFGQTWIAQSDDVVLLHEPGRYPVAYFPKDDVNSDVLVLGERTTEHRDLGPTVWYGARVDEREAARAAWEHTALPEFARPLADRIAFAWRAMDAFYEEDERIVGHAADAYHRIDIRQTSRHLVVRVGAEAIAESRRPLVLYESGFAPRWYVPADDVSRSALEPADLKTFCPYKGVCSYYDIGDAHRAAWSYPDPYREVERIQGMISFEPDKVTVVIDGAVQRLAPGQQVISHGADRNLALDEAVANTRA